MEVTVKNSRDLNNVSNLVDTDYDDFLVVPYFAEGAARGQPPGLHIAGFLARIPPRSKTEGAASRGQGASPPGLKLAGFLAQIPPPSKAEGAARGLD